MAIANSLPYVEPFFMQTCPLCATPQRMMIRGNYLHDGKWQRFPDMGYSFCNCRNIFYTKWENINRTQKEILHDAENNSVSWNSVQFPLDRLKYLFDEIGQHQEAKISMLDPYFINWQSPHEMKHWLCRKVYLLMDMNSWADECRKVGFEVISAVRDMDVASETPECYHVTVRKP